MSSFRDRIVKPTPALKKSTLLLGPSGTGKTFQCGTLIEGGMKTLYASVEQKLASIEALSPDVYPIVNCDYPKDSIQANSTKSDLYELVKFLQTPDHGYDAVCLDSGMRFGDELLKILKKTMSGYDLWGAFAEKFEAAMTGLTKLTSVEATKSPVHVVVTMGVEMGLDWKQRRTWQPLLDGKKISPRLPYLFDNVLVLMRREDADKGNLEWVCYTAGTDEFDAKVSSARVKLEPVIRNPNLCTILKRITEGK